MSDEVEIIDEVQKPAEVAPETVEPTESVSKFSDEDIQAVIDFVIKLDKRMVALCKYLDIKFKEDAGRILAIK